MDKKFFFSTTVGILLLIIANTYKIHIKPAYIPYILPIWFCSAFVVAISFFKDKRKKLVDLYISPVSLILLIYSYLSWKNYEKSNVIETTLSEPSTIVLICLLSKIFLGTKITKIRISAIFTITIGVILPVLFSKNMSNIDPMVVFKHVAVNVVFCLINMIFEIKIKAKISSIWSFLFTSNFMIFTCGLIFLIYQYIIKQIVTFNFLKDKKVYLICMLESYSSIFNFLLVFLFKPVPRTLLRLLVSSLAGLYEGIFLIHSVKFLDVISLFIVSFGVFLYNTDYFEFHYQKIQKQKEKRKFRSSVQEFEESIASLSEDSDTYY